MTTALVIGGLVGFVAGAVCMWPGRRKARHGRASRGGAWRQVYGALLIFHAKGVYAGNAGESNPAQQEQSPHHASTA